MNRLPGARRAEIAGMLMEGMSLRFAARLSGASTNTVSKLMVDLGTACEAYQRRALVDLKCKRVQCDKFWSFAYTEDRNAPPEMKRAGMAGEVWTWTALDADSKLIVSWLVGGGDAGYAYEFVQKVAQRFVNRIQLTTDGHKPYLVAAEGAPGCDVDYAQLVKICGEAPEGQRRYGPGAHTGCKKTMVQRHPHPVQVATSYLESQNLTTKVSMRRFTHLTNGIAKKIEHHAAAVALYCMWYNFGRIHKALRVTPAMKADIADHAWTLAEIVALLG